MQRIEFDLNTRLIGFVFKLNFWKKPKWWKKGEFLTKSEIENWKVTFNRFWRIEISTHQNTIQR